MKYTNPLQSKILLHSALHAPWQNAPQDWLDLKRHTLHSLLGTLLHTCTAYTELEFLLYSTARRLPHPEAAIQTATDVIKCLRPFYLYGGPAALPPASLLSMPTASLTPDPLAPAPNTLTDATAQLLTPAPESTQLLHPLPAHSISPR